MMRALVLPALALGTLTTATTTRGGKAMYQAVRFSSSSAAAVLIGLGLTFANGGALAQAGPTTVRITEVLVEFDDTIGDMITIRGVNFDSGGVPTITLGGDLTPLVIVGTPTASEIVVECPWGEAVPECVDGDFQLTVTTGSGATQTATYDLTIGAVGPQGEPGPQGLPGAGIAGQSCPTDEFVTGFDTGGTLICTPLPTGGGGGGSGGGSLCETECDLASIICEFSVQRERQNCVEQKAQCDATGGSDCDTAFELCVADLRDCGAERTACLAQCPVE